MWKTILEIIAVTVGAGLVMLIVMLAQIDFSH